MLDRLYRQVDVQLGPVQMVGARSLYRRDFTNRGVLEPRELLERQKQFPLV